MALVLVTGLMLCLPVHLDATTVAPSERLGNVESTSNTVVNIMSASPPGEWTEMHPASAPSPRTVNWMAYDSVSDKVILFGGRISYYGCYNETWAYDFDTDTWTNMTQPVAPSSRFAHAMAYDSQSNRVILFGGSNQLEQFSDTWAFNYEQNEWTNMNPIVAPSPRADFGMVYDSQSDRVILFGGYAGYDIDETWSYDFETNSWTNMNPTPKPPARFTMAIAYDIQSDRVLIFGGAGGGLRDDMWAYDFEGNTWTEMHPAVRPPPSYGTRFSYDSHADRTVMFGGDNPNPPYYYNDTWTYDFDVNVWTKIDVYPRPFGRGYQGMAYDSRSARSIIFGGAEGSPTVFFNDTWAFLELVAHDPILIDGNAEFTDANGVVAGSGTESDPYVIVGWDISASTANGIEIRNTDAHFVIRDCHVHDGGSNYDGIHLYDCANGTLDGNNCSSNNYYGIYLDSSSNNNLNNNTCIWNNNRAIGLYSSNDDTLTNNTCSNSHDGIWLYSTSGNTLSNNTCSNAWYGICLEYSGGFTISGNNCSNNGYGIELYFSSGNTISNNSCFSNWGEGMHLDQSHGNTLSNNNCSDNVVGILIYFSNDNNLSYNTCSSNSQYGIYLAILTSGNTISNNIFIGNNGASSTYDPSHVQGGDDGTNNRWNSTDGYGNYWSDWTGPDADMDGIVDVPYDIAGSAGAKDYYPLTTPLNSLPVAIFTVSPSTGTILTTFSFNASLSYDNQDPSSSLEVRWDWNDDGTWDTVRSTTKTATHQYSVPGTYTVRMEVNDTGGMMSQTTRPVIVVNTAPTASFTAAPSSGNITQTFSFDASSSSDLEDAVDLLEVRWDWENDGTWDTGWTTTKTAVHQYTSNGVKSVGLAVRDTGGLESTTVRTLTVVEAPPVTTVTLGGAIGTNNWYVSSVTLNLSAADDASGVNETKYRLNGGTWHNYAGNVALSNDGTTLVEYYSTDFGGFVETVKSVTVRIDKTDPTLTFNQTSGFEANADHVTISWISSDATSGIDHFEVSIDGGAFTSVGTAMSHNFWLADGTHDVTVRAVDAAGNEITQTLQFTVDTSGTGGGASGDLMLYGGVVAIILVVVVIAIALMMRKKKVEPPAPPPG